MSPLAAFRHPGRESRLTVHWLVTLTLAALMLCTVAIINVGPIYYNDTGSYLIDADRLMHRHAPYGVRPPFYGVLIWICHDVVPFGWIAGFSLALFMQALVLSHIIHMTIRAVGAALRPAGFLLLTAALVLLTPVSFHVSHLLPDIYLAVMTLALFLLAFCSETLRRAEVIYLSLLATGSACLHLTAFPVGAAIVGLAILLAVSGRRWARPVRAAAPWPWPSSQCSGSPLRSSSG